MTTNKLPKKSYSAAELEELRQEREQQAADAATFMVLLETEGRCEVGSDFRDGRRRCRRKDTILPAVYVGDGTREGTLVRLGKVCMRHLPEMIALVKKEAPGGNGADFKEPRFGA